MWQEFIRPTKAELAWAEIPWKSTFYDGLIESDMKQKPVLLLGNEWSSSRMHMK
ncbi:hypothetical protein Ct9H90mP12_3240 [bacterium]|nr:MAG: hypothetical protein Ct9H90mP12_3240 [bacterium]